MESRLPLSGVSVVDLTRNVAGPWAAMVLAELGADVVKVEQPRAGDDTRHWGPPFWGGESPVFLALNRNKRSLTLDLREPEARPVLERLVASTDVVLESFRPGALERLGYGYAWAAARNARIVYCSITSFGERGPLRDRPGYDPLMQACGGIMSVTGEPGRAPVRVGVSLVDMGTGMWAALAVMAALLRVRETGRGQRIASSLYETALVWMCYHLAAYWAGGDAPGRHGSGTATIAPYEAFAAKDGYLVIAAGNDSLFARLCDALGHPQWICDARFRRNADRVRHRQALRAEIEAVTRTWTTDRLADRLSARGLPCSPIRSVDAVAADPQALALGIFQRLSHPAIPDFQSVGLPFLLEGERPRLRRPPPQCGEHNAEILAEMGFSPEEVAQLLTSPAVAGGPPPAEQRHTDARGREPWTSN